MIRDTRIQFPVFADVECFRTRADDDDDDVHPSSFHVFGKSYLKIDDAMITADSFLFIECVTSNIVL